MATPGAVERGRRVLITGGGTGGHIFPGLAIAGELSRRDPSTRVLFVGTRYGMERRIVPKSGFALRTLRVKGLRGKGPLDTLASLALLPVGLAQALAVLLRFKPDVVVGVGGYASFPVGLLAWLLGRKLMVQEQNIEPGLANRVLGRIAGRAAVSFEATVPRFVPGKAVWTGNPVREAFGRIGPPPEGPPQLLIFGGSRGARAINRAVAAALPALKAAAPELGIRHQTGVEDEVEIQRAYAAVGVEAKVCAFIDDMPGALAACHLALCRSGASTVAELTAAGRPAVLVPFPFATGGHQAANAEVMAGAGAAEVIAQAELTPERLAETVARLAGDRDRLAGMAEESRKLGRPDAAARIADLLEAMMAPAGPAGRTGERERGEIDR